MKNFSEMLFASAVVIGLFWLVSADRQGDLFTVTIESTELWRNPWPAPGDQTHVANGQCGTPSSVCAPADGSQTNALKDDLRVAF